MINPARPAITALLALLAIPLFCTAATPSATASATQPAAAPDNTAVFQYGLDFTYDNKGQPRTGNAWLWVPTSHPQVRGVIVAGLTSMERRFVKHPTIRKACDDAGLAILFVNTGLRTADVPALLAAFAKESGYDELPRAPLMFVGHSAGGPQAQFLATQFADRCFGLIQHRGGLSKDVPPGVPALAAVGQFDEFAGTMRDENGREGAWEGSREATAQMRSAQPGKLASMIVDAGAGHFAFSQREADYLALFIRKAADARIPADWHKQQGEKPVLCNAVDPGTGWLTDLNLRNPAHPPAPVAKYKGDAGQASWHFDEELAKSAAAFHAVGLSRKDQFITWQDRVWVDGGARIHFHELAWVDDGQTFEVRPAYRDTIPEQINGQGPRWPNAGQPVGHARTPLKVRDVQGPLVTVGPNKIRFQFDGLNPASQRIRAFFIAYSEGDETYRYTEHVGFPPRAFAGFTAGADQTITFPPIGNLTAASAPIPLQATSSAGLPVEYYVDFGPGKIVDGKLTLAEMPPRAQFPLKLKVTAYQFGRGINPKVKTAVPVSQTVQITR